MVTIKKVSRKSISNYNEIVDIDGFYTFLRGGKNGLFLLRPLEQLKEVSIILIEKRKNVILSFDTFVNLLKEIYGIKHYKHKFCNLIFLLTTFEKFYGEEFTFLSYNEKLISRVLTTKSSKAIGLQSTKS